MSTYRSGRHFLQIPGPTNVPDRVLRALAQPTIDHRSEEFAGMTREILSGLQHVFNTSGPVVVYPSSATGAWEAAFVNTLSPGDKVLSFEIGEFARLWAELARRIGLSPTRLRRIFSTAFASHSACFARKDWSTSLRDTAGWPEQPAPRCAPGASRSCVVAKTNAARS